VRGVQLAVLAVLVLGGCAGHKGDQAVSVYMWNESGRELGYRPDPLGEPPEYGVVSAGKQTTGCIWRPEGWSIEILDSPPTPVSPDRTVAQVNGAPYPGSEADVWIHMDTEGRIETGGAVPGWWSEARQVCS
jgi:hypothetical protein